MKLLIRNSQAIRVQFSRPNLPRRSASDRHRMNNHTVTKAMLKVHSSCACRLGAAGLMASALVAHATPRNVVISLDGATPRILEQYVNAGVIQGANSARLAVEARTNASSCSRRTRSRMISGKVLIIQRTYWTTALGGRSNLLGRACKFANRL